MKRYAMTKVCGEEEEGVSGRRRENRIAVVAKEMQERKSFGERVGKHFQEI